MIYILYQLVSRSSGGRREHNEGKTCAPSEAPAGAKSPVGKFLLPPPRLTQLDLDLGYPDGGQESKRFPHCIKLLLFT